MNRFWRYKLDQVIFWTATIGFHMFTRIDLTSEAGVEQFILEIVLRNSLLAMVIYFNWNVLIPKYARHRKILAYIFFIIVSLAIYAFLKNLHDAYLYGYVLGDEGRRSVFYNVYYNFSIALFYLTFHIALQLSKEWYFQRALIRKMEVERLSTELEYLKAQINPHFVFNTINTIYFQIDKENIAARESLSAFSEMMRYQLYECNGKEIPITKEIAYLKNYVALQRMRKDENYDISFGVNEQIKDVFISPLLFIPFIENAFKHVSHRPHSNRIEIEIDRKENSIVLWVFNTKDNNAKVNGHAGIGLKNVQRRLDLLYKDRHELKIESHPDCYEVTLSIRLNGIKEKLK